MSSTKVESEKALERKLCAWVKEIGGWAVKLPSSQVTGLPDRLVLINGKAYFVEVKTTGLKPSKIQSVIHTKLRGLGFLVYVIDSTEKINDFIFMLQC